MFLMLKYALLSATVLMLVALGGCFSEHSGVINLALEGIMVIGGLVGTMALNLLPADMLPVWKVVTFYLAGVCVLHYLSPILFFSTNNKSRPHTRGDSALNLLSTAIALVVVKRYNGTQSAKLSYDNSPFIFPGWSSDAQRVSDHRSGAAGSLNRPALQNALRSSSAGFAASIRRRRAPVGINVYKMRWAGVLISGFLAGIGGFVYIVPAVQTWNFEVGVAGMGFLALAVMIFGQWEARKDCPGCHLLRGLQVAGKHLRLHRLAQCAAPDEGAFTT